MGAGNVKAVFGYWGHLPDPAFRLLVYMALTAKDDDAVPAFWGGRESMAIGIGRKGPHDDADYRAVSRALSKLRDAGAIVLDRHSAPGLTARHELRLDPNAPNTGRDATPEQATPGDRDTGRPATEHTTPSDRTHDARRRPEEEQEPQGLTSGHTNPSGLVPQPGAREDLSRDLPAPTGADLCRREIRKSPATEQLDLDEEARTA